MKRLLLFASLLFLSLVTPAQTPTELADASGEWYGLITQVPAGLDGRYIFQLNLEVEGDVIHGTSMIAIEDDPKAWGIMDITGELWDGELYIREVEITSQSLYRFAYWCIKSYRLVPTWTEGKWALKGAWESDYCADSVGEIFLERRMS
jgi:hypothetical protein